MSASATKPRRSRRGLTLLLMILSLALLIPGCILIGPGTGPDVNDDELVADTCPASHPNDCGDFCCPTGTTCNGNAAVGARCAVNNNNPDPDLGDIGDDCDDDDDCQADLECLLDDADEYVCSDG